MNWWCAIANLELNFDANENQDLSSQTLADVPHTRVCENRKKAHIFIKNVNNQIIVHIQCSSFGCLQSLLFGTHSSCGSRQYIVISSVKIIANNSHKFYFIFILVLLKREIDTRTHTHTSNGHTHTYTHCHLMNMVNAMWQWQQRQRYVFATCIEITWFGRATNSCAFVSYIGIEYKTHKEAKKREILVMRFSSEKPWAQF